MSDYYRNLNDDEIGKILDYYPYCSNECLKKSSNEINKIYS